MKAISFFLLFVIAAANTGTKTTAQKTATTASSTAASTASSTCSSNAELASLKKEHNAEISKLMSEIKQLNSEVESVGQRYKEAVGKLDSAKIDAEEKKTVKVEFWSATCEERSKIVVDWAVVEFFRTIRISKSLLCESWKRIEVFLGPEHATKIKSEISNMKVQFMNVLNEKVFPVITKTHETIKDVAGEKYNVLIGYYPHIEDAFVNSASFFDTALSEHNIQYHGMGNVKTAKPSGMCLYCKIFSLIIFLLKLRYLVIMPVMWFFRKVLCCCCCCKKKKVAAATAASAAKKKNEETAAKRFHPTSDSKKRA